MSDKTLETLKPYGMHVILIPQECKFASEEALRKFVLRHIKELTTFEIKAYNVDGTFPIADLHACCVARIRTPKKHVYVSFRFNLDGSGLTEDFLMNITPNQFLEDYSEQLVNAIKAELKNQ